MLRVFLAIVVASGLLVSPAAAQLGATVDERGIVTIAPLLEEVTPAVVNIAVVGERPVETNPLFRDPFFRRFFDFDLPEMPRRRPRASAGSGVIVDAGAGHVLTNHHVIEGAGEITVTLQDGRRLDATLVGSDPDTDIALLEIAADGLTAIPLGDSDLLKVGDVVVAVGNPFGLGQTVTSGIISALGRGGLNVEGYEDFIQTDAPINPGNSGGALVTLDGRLIGINTAILTPAGGNVGIGFAVPSNMARAVMEQLIEHGEVRRGRLGVMIQNVTPDLAEALGLEHARGAVVVSVEEGSAAARAGLEPGDVITAVDGREIADSRALRNAIGLTPLGSRVTLTVQRDGREHRLEARIGEGERAAAAPSGTADRAALAGARLDNLGPDMPGYGQVEGVPVTDVQPGSPAARLGLRAGDVIVAINRRPVTSLADLDRAIREVGRVAAVRIYRDGAELFLVVP